MLDLASPLLDRLAAGSRVVVVTVTRVARSAPRGLGASMAVVGDGEVIGSISGGCVEGDSVMLAHAVLGDGEARTARFGFDDDTAHAAGLACGGQVDVIAFEVRADDATAVDALRTAADDRPTTIGLVLDGPRAGRVVRRDDPALDDRAAADLDAAALLAETRVVAGGLAERRTSRPPEDESPEIVLPSASSPPAGTTDGPGAAGRVLAVSRAPRPRLIVAGASDHAAALCRVAAAAGFAVTIVDAWELLVTSDRFPDAAELVVALPHEHLAGLGPDDIDARTAVCVLTHDTRLDVPALRQALAMPIGFVGALGARTTAARRVELLREAGASDDDLARLHSPLGLDLGGSSPAETAVSVVAEILAARHGGTGRPLRDLAGPLHRDRPLAEAALPRAGARPDAVSCAIAPPPPGRRSIRETRGS
ncbi:XdhC family protein [Microbacterium betulae]|uniref:XdhC family protein n=1 Tax=Microbacterium betulae TaxID=2981139 RepID=A0AA97FI67_9MICO|nr:XdhC family protein [Microbacterium sp. AB]WOF22745.1 XdhC family protein [Microbacterium sp. AB]